MGGVKRRCPCSGAHDVIAKKKKKKQMEKNKKSFNREPITAHKCGKVRRVEPRPRDLILWCPWSRSALAGLSALSPPWPARPERLLRAEEPMLFFPQTDHVGLMLRRQVHVLPVSDCTFDYCILHQLAVVHASVHAAVAEQWCNDETLGDIDRQVIRSSVPGN